MAEDVPKTKKVDLFNRGRAVQVIYQADGSTVEIPPGHAALVLLAEPEAKRLEGVSKADWEPLQIGAPSKDTRRVKTVNDDDAEVEDPIKRAQEPYMPRMDASGQDFSGEEERQRVAAENDPTNPERRMVNAPASANAPASPGSAGQRPAPPQSKERTGAKS